MRKLIFAALAVVVVSAAVAVNDADIVLSNRRVGPGADLEYWGKCSAGYLYAGTAGALAAVAPYRVLDAGVGAGRTYYVVCLPEPDAWADKRFAVLGSAARLSPTEILVGVDAGVGPGAIRGIAPKAEIIRLAPITASPRKSAAETPPTHKNSQIESAVAAITRDEYGKHIATLASFGTRYTDTEGYCAGRVYIHNYLGMQNLDVTDFPLQYIGFRDVAYPKQNGPLYVVNDCASIFRSDDAGVTWDTVRPPVNYGINASYFLDENNIFLLGYPRDFVKTDDGGVSWEVFEYEPPTEDYYNPNDLHFANANVGWVGGMVWRTNHYDGFMKKTTDGGRTWHDQTLPAGFLPYRFEFYDQNRGWMSGYGGGFAYTVNSGATWQVCPGSFPRAHDLVVTGPTTAWAAFNMSVLAKTTDGVNWSWVDPGVNAVFSNLDFLDTSRGYAGGTALIKTSNGGSTWTTVGNTPEMRFELMSFADVGHGVFGDLDAENLYLTDDGASTFEDILGGVDVITENVVGERRGTKKPDEVIIVCGHADSIAEDSSLAPGAEDNASGTAVAMAAAHAFRNTAFERTVRYVGFSGEELGLFGSRAYAAYCAEEGENVVAVLNADMISYDEEKGGRADVSIAHDEDNYQWLYNYLVAVGNLYGNNLVYDSYEFTGSDHSSFWSYDYAAIGAIEGEKGVGGVVGYPYYHTKDDTYDKLQPAFGARVARDFAAALAHLAGVDGTFPDPPGPNTAVGKPSFEFAVYPNPYRISGNTAGVHFAGLATPATVEIYDLAGRKVATWTVSAGTDSCSWQPATEAGAALAAGVYLYRVSGAGQNERGKLAIVK